MKTISELYQQEGAPFLSRLHEATGANKKYLYHIAVGLRRPSPEMALRLVKADNRLSFERLLLPDWPELVEDGAGIARPEVAAAVLAMGRRQDARQGGKNKRQKKRTRGGK